MNLISALFLGTLQGFTEFLPVSSSGHLVIAQSLISGFSQPGVLFDVILHAGTLLAVVFYFRKTIFEISPSYLLLLFIGTVPAAIFGFFFREILEGMFTNITLVGLALLITGAMNFFTDRARLKKKKVTLKESLLVGLAQALAIIPGLSRSGATIFAGTTSGLDRGRAAEFSFLLSVPAVLGASILQLMTHGVANELELSIYAIGFLSAFITGYFSIGFVLKSLLLRRFKYFAYYAGALGLLVILLS